MGARPLRRAIQRYIEDPLADEVLKQGEMASGSTVMVDRDSDGDDEDRPLKLTIIAPTKPPKKAEPEKVGVGAKASEETTSGEQPDPDFEPDPPEGPAPESG
jgi:ATP-dependent Clp protease ATP-binding subunit ClpC